MIGMWDMYPDAGVHEMIGLLFHEHDMAVSRSVNIVMIGLQNANYKVPYRSTMRAYFLTYEPHLLRQCKANRLQHHRFWATGVNDIWAIDQHNKWLWFGLALHTGIEPFSGRIVWMKVWHSNHNPQLILSYYLETVEASGCECLADVFVILLIGLHTSRCPHGDTE